VRSDFLTPLITDSTGFFDMKPCRAVEIYRLFGVTYCLSSSSVFYVEDGGRQHVPRKRRYIYADKDLNIPENNIQLKKRWARHVARMRERIGAYRVLAGKAEGKELLGGPRRRWED
jgi:hypothetical protein